MRAFCRARAMSNAFVILTSVLLVAVGSANVFPADEPVAGRMPDVLIWIDVRSPGAHWVSITYPKVVSRSQAENHLAGLLKETGWTAASISIADGSVEKSGGNPMTSVEFVTPSAVQMESGVLPIEPIVKAFRDLQNIEIQYLAPPTFYFRGLEDYENKYVKIELNRGNNAYRYTIRVKNSEFSTLDLPLPAAQTEDGGDERSRGVSTLAISIVIIIVALIAATAAYIVAARFTNKGRQTRG